MKKLVYISLLPVLMTSLSGCSQTVPSSDNYIPEYITIIASTPSDYRFFFQRCGDEYYYIDERGSQGYYYNANQEDKGTVYEIEYMDENPHFEALEDFIEQDENMSFIARFYEYFSVLMFFDTSIIQEQELVKGASEMIGEYECDKYTNPYDEEFVAYLHKYTYSQQNYYMFMEVNMMIAFDEEEEKPLYGTYKVESFDFDGNILADSPNHKIHSQPKF